MAGRKKYRLGFFHILLLGTFFIVGFTIYTSPFFNRERSGYRADNSVEKEYERKYNEALNMLKGVDEVNYIENKVLENGRTPYYITDKIEGEVITISLRESFPDDPHTTRIDTFIINLSTKEIFIEDVINGEDIPLNRWRITVAQRFQ